MRSKIHTNRVGYGVRSSKKAICSEAGSRQSVFRLINASTGKTMIAGHISKPVYDEASADNTAEVDFSTFNLAGEYYIKAGRRCSDKFVIREKPYRELNKALLKAFYYNRCGALDESYAGEYSRGKCHSSPAAFFEDREKTTDVSGGWHDSGSYGKYSYTACIALAHLLYAFRLFPSAFDGKGNIPSSPENMPDILAECRYELEWLLKMQDKSGGVYSKVCSADISASVMPEEDEEPQYVFPCTHQSTAAFVAAAALAAGIYESYDKDLSDLLQSAAFSGWTWIYNNPVYKPFENPAGVKHITYSDEPDKNYEDLLFWTVCELYAMTGEDIFRKKINDLHKRVCVTGFEPRRAGGFGALAYMLCSRRRDYETERAIRLQFRVDADNLVSLSEKSGYGTAKAPGDYSLNSNISIAANAVTLIAANKILGCENYLETAEAQVAYILGLNPMGVCYVTGFGEDSVKNPHHRPSVFDDIEAPVPGLAVGGANAYSKDDYARWNIPKGTPPAKCYCDNGFCYSTNEFSICCCSSLLFAAAFFDSGS